MIDAPRELATFDALTPLDRAIVQVLAVASQATPRTTLMGYLKHLGLRQVPNGKAITNDVLLAWLRRLVEGGLVVLDESNYRCHPLLENEVMERAVRDGQLAPIMAAIDAVSGNDGSGQRALRAALFARDFSRATELIKRLDRSAEGHPLRLMLQSRFDEHWVRRWPEPIVADALASVFEYSLVHFLAADEPFAFLEGYCVAAPRSPALCALLALQLSLRGRLDEAPKWVAGVGAPESLAAEAWLAFLRRDVATATTTFARWRAAPGVADTPPWIAKMGLLAGVLALLEQGDHPQVLRVVRETTERRETAWLSRVLDLVKLPASVAMGLLRPAGDLEVRLDGWVNYSDLQIVSVFRVVARGWFGLNGADSYDVRDVRGLRDKAVGAGYLWLVTELDDVLAAMEGAAQTARGRLREVVTRNEPWRRALDALDRLVAQPVVAPKTAAQEPTTTGLRFGWVLELRGTRCDLRPIEQKLDAKGKWTQGRRVALERLYTDSANMQHLSEQDRAVVACLRATTVRPYGYPETTYDFQPVSSLRALLRHPNVYLDGPSPARVDLVEGTPVLTVTDEGEHTVMRMVPTL